MTKQLTSAQVWAEIEKEMFGVLGMVTARQQSRTAGIVYIVRDGKMYIGTGKQSWKARHVGANPQVSMTIPIAKRIPFIPWVKIPAATITFSGTARVLAPAETDPSLLKAVFQSTADDPQRLADSCLIEVTPQKDFVTYGIGVSLSDMRDPQKARGRAGVNAEAFTAR